MKRLLLFLAKLLLFSLLLVPVLPKFDYAYRFVLVFVTTWTLPSQEAILAIPYRSAVKLYPFFVLLLSTPGLMVRKRLLGVAGGILLYLLLDLFMILVWGGKPFLQIPNPTMTHIVLTNIWDMLGHWLLPFLLWFLVAFRQIEGMRKGQMQAEPVM